MNNFFSMILLFINVNKYVNTSIANKNIVITALENQLIACDVYIQFHRTFIHVRERKTSGKIFVLIKNKFTFCSRQTPYRNCSENNS